MSTNDQRAANFQRRPNYRPRRNKARPTPSNVTQQEHQVAENNQFALGVVPGETKIKSQVYYNRNYKGKKEPKHANTNNQPKSTRPPITLATLNKRARYHKRRLSHFLRRRAKLKVRSMAVTGASAAPGVSSEAASEMAGLGEAPSTDREKLVSLGLQSVFYNAARGWYAAIRKACFAYGPRSYNDKYFTDIINRNSDPAVYNTYNIINASHTGMINFLYQVLMQNYNYLVTQDVNKLLVRLPEHLSFLVHTAAQKFLVKVRNGVVNLANKQPIQYITPKDPAPLVSIGYVDPQAWLTLQLQVCLLNQLFAIQAHTAYPFKTTDKPAIILKDILVHDQHGVSTKTDMHMNEIVSVYGYSTEAGGSRYYGNYFYDLSGLEQNKLTNIYRFFFFPVFTDLSIYDPPDKFNESRINNYYFDSNSYTVYFGLTGKVSTSDYCYVAEVPRFNSDGDFSTSTSVEQTSVNNKGLNYLLQKYNSNNTRPAPFKPTARALPNFPEVAFSPNAYNLALFMAQALHSRYQLFAQKPFVRPDYNDGIDTILANFTANYFSTMNECSYDIGVYLIQYDNRFTLPSPIVEQFKTINSYNTWSYTDSSKSITMQVLLSCARVDLGSGLDFNRPSNGNLFMFKGGSNVPSTASWSNIKDMYQTYDGIKYNPLTYDTVLNNNDNAMAEIRPYVKLNNCPEVESVLPSMHLMYFGYLSGSTIEDTANAVYTPLDTKAFHDKNMNIFIKYTLLPEITVVPGLNIPLLNITNLVMPTVNQDKPIFNLYQMSFVASYSGPSSEMDMYYSMLRKTMIGSWSDLAPVIGKFSNMSLGAVMKKYPQSAPYINQVFDLINSPQAQKLLPKMGAYGDFINMLGTPVRNVTNYDEDGYTGVNVQPPPQQSKPKKTSFWDGLLDGVKDFMPQLIKMAPELMEMVAI